MATDGVHGQEQLRDLSQRLTRAGQEDLRRTLAEALVESAKPLADAVDQAIPQYLPSRGGLAALVQGIEIDPRVSVTQSQVRVKLRGKKGGRDLRRMDAGVVRHPVHGHPWVWVGQSIRAGFWTKTLEGRESTIARSVGRAVARFAKGLER